MTTHQDSIHNPDLLALGDDLERAFERDLAATTGASSTARKTWRRKAIVIPAALAVAGFGAGAAAAAGLFSADEVATGITRNLLFGDTQASCTTTDEVVYDCTVSAPPPGEPAGANPKDSGSPEAVSYAGAVYPMVIDDRVAGGCRGDDAAGLDWTCFVGQRAVDEKIIGQDFLGEAVPAGVRPVG